MRYAREVEIYCRGHVSQAATESSMGGDRGGRPRKSEGRPAAVKRIPPGLRSAVAEDGGSDAASRSRGGLERREASLSPPVSEVLSAAARRPLKIC